MSNVLTWWSSSRFSAFLFFSSQASPSLVVYECFRFNRVSIADAGCLLPLFWYSTCTEVAWRDVQSRIFYRPFFSSLTFFLLEHEKHFVRITAFNLPFSLIKLAFLGNLSSKYPNLHIFSFFVSLMLRPMERCSWSRSARDMTSVSLAAQPRLVTQLPHRHFLTGRRS